MKTLEDLKSHPLANLFRARFDNNDMAFALDLPTFPEWRKNGERNNYFVLPRNAENPVRPKYTYAHAAEYMLNVAAGSVTTKAAASRLTQHFLKFNKDHADERFLEFDEHSKQVMLQTNSFRNVEPDSAAEYERLEYWPLVNVPAVGFAPEFLDRSPQRLADPVYWLIAPDFAETSSSRFYCQVNGKEGINDSLAALSKHRWMQPPDAIGGPKYRAASFINITGVLGDMEARLRLRLEANALSGADGE